MCETLDIFHNCCHHKQMQWPIHHWQSLMTKSLTLIGESPWVIWTVWMVLRIRGRITGNLEPFSVILSIIITTRERKGKTPYQIPCNNSLMNQFTQNYTQVLLTISTSHGWLTWWPLATTKLSAMLQVLAAHALKAISALEVVPPPPDWKHKTQEVYISMCLQVQMPHITVHMVPHNLTYLLISIGSWDLQTKQKNKSLGYKKKVHAIKRNSKENTNKIKYNFNNRTA